MLAYTNEDFVRLMFNGFAVGHKYYSHSINFDNVEMGPYKFLVNTTGWQYNLYFNNEAIRSGHFPDMVKYAIGHHNRNKMNEYLEDMKREEMEYEEPDASYEAEDRAYIY